MNHSPEELRQALSATEVHGSDVHRILGEVNRRATIRRRWQRAGTAGALTLVAGAAVGVLALSPPTGSGQAGPTGAVTTSAASPARQAAGLQLTSGVITEVAREDDHVVAVVQNQAGGAAVNLALYNPGAFKLGDRADGEKVTVNGRTGYYNVRQADAEIAVEQEPDTWLVLTTPARFDTARQAMLDVASVVELIEESELPEQERPSPPPRR